MDGSWGKIAVDRVSCIRVMGITDNPHEPSNMARLLLQGSRGVRPNQTKEDLALNCYLNYMINNAKQGGYRIPLVGNLCCVYCMLSCYG